MKIGRLIQVLFFLCSLLSCVILIGANIYSFVQIPDGAYYAPFRAPYLEVEKLPDQEFRIVKSGGVPIPMAVNIERQHLVGGKVYYEISEMPNWWISKEHIMKK